MKTGLRMMSCTGAVVGAGFASGREIVSFFTQYGEASWGLIALSAGGMGALCWLILRSAAQGGQRDWDGLVSGRFSRLCTVLLMTITAGAMISAAGQIIALLWATQWAYSAGAVGTLLAAWKCGEGCLKRLGWLGGIATGMLVLVLAACLLALPQTQTVVLPVKRSGGWIRAIAYAGMNMTLAIGVICGCSQPNPAMNRRIAIGFGGVMLLLLGLSNAFYLRQPQTLNTSFPIVRLLSHFGRKGFLMSAALLYLAIFTTLASVLFALRTAAEARISHPALRSAAVLGIPLLVSCAGFDGLVGSVYAPVGLGCICAVFLPMFLGSGQRNT